MQPRGSSFANFDHRRETRNSVRVASGTKIHTNGEEPERTEGGKIKFWFVKHSDEVLMTMIMYCFIWDIQQPVWLQVPKVKWLLT